MEWNIPSVTPSKFPLKEKFTLERLFVQTNKIVLLPADIKLVFTKTFLLHCLNVLKLLGVVNNKKDMAFIRYLQFEKVLKISMCQS